MLIIWVEPFPGSHMQTLAHSNSMGGEIPHIPHMFHIFYIPWVRAPHPINVYHIGTVP